MRRKTDTSKEDRQPVLICIAMIYLFFVMYITLFDREIGRRRIMLEPFFEIRKMIKTQKYEHWLGQIFGNIFLFFPLGVFLPMIFDFFKKTKMTVLAGFIVSLFIELTQYITGRGLCELDDVVHNTIGAFAGIIIYKKIRYLLRNKIDL